MKNVILLDETCNFGKNYEKELLGGKGKNLGTMMQLGLPVPSGMIVTTEACRDYFEKGKTLSFEIKAEILKELEKLEKKTGKSFGGEDLLLVSIRSGAPVSMPGMMDTILNLGLNENSIKILAKNSGNASWAFEIYIRFIEMFSEIVKGISREKMLEAKKMCISSKEIVRRYKALYRDTCGEEFPEDPKDQIFMAVEAIFNSWNNERAKFYRKINNIDEKLGTAVVIQEMVFGNYNENSGTGVAFTRNPSDGKKELYGEYLLQAQGEDIVAGIRTPYTISHMKIQLPEIYNEFMEICAILENHYRDMQDIEFTIENGKLFILQTRNGKRTPNACIKIPMDMVKEGLINKEEAIMRVDANHIPQLFSGNFCEKSEKTAFLLTKGVPGSAGVAVGKVVLSSDRIQLEEDSILVRGETSPEDIKGMSIAKGIVTVRGGATSHGAVVARGMGKCCVTGCENMKINEEDRYFTVNGILVKEGEVISVNGYSGEIYRGALKIKEENLDENFKEFLDWCKKIKNLKVRMNADTPEDLIIGKNFGADGVGLCRTEHMFFQQDRILSVRKMIVAKNKEERMDALNNLYKMQKNDFYKMIKTLDGAPFNVRLLDPPFHEFLPKTEKDVEALAVYLDKSNLEIKNRIAELKEENPMLGHRGSRLAVTFPEIYEMQALALLDAALKCQEEKIPTNLEIMLPFIGGISEFKHIKNNIFFKIQKFFQEQGKIVEFKLGTMMELPRACLLADEIAEESHFFSFGTNDLTQTTYGISRDDSSKFINSYVEKNIMKNDPFQSIDTRGVGKLINIAKSLGKVVNPQLKIGICGEHGGDPESIEYFHKIGMNYVSCSPYRVPIAIVAAAQSVIKSQ